MQLDIGMNVYVEIKVVLKTIYQVQKQLRLLTKFAQNVVTL